MNKQCHMLTCRYNHKAECIDGREYKMCIDVVKQVLGEDRYNSLQKEPCEYCGVFDTLLLPVARKELCIKVRFCPNCGRRLNQFGKDINVATTGDKIRESNESLAKFIETITDKCIRGKCLECQLYKACDREDNAKDIEDYLNQPYTE